jgi:hypothetical protein
MQVPSFNANDAMPAAPWAVPGTRLSCAVKPGAARSAASIRSGESHRGRTGISLHRGAAKGFGQDRRYEKDQRGRAVACV